MNFLKPSLKREGFISNEPVYSYHLIKNPTIKNLFFALILRLKPIKQKAKVNFITTPAHLVNALPHFTIALPHFTIVLPHFTIALPHFTIALPHFTIALPHFINTSPHFIFRVALK